MVDLISALVSILIVTFAVWLLNRLKLAKVCPICAGVSLTWFWMLIAHFAGYEIELMMPAILMGGSVVGIAYQLERKMPNNYLPVLWKTLFLPAGFSGVYGLVTGRIWLFVLALLASLILVFIFWPKKNEALNPRAQDLENKMKGCCS